MKLRSILSKVAPILACIAWLLVWLLFRPLMASLGVWPDLSATLDAHDSLQLLSAFEMTLSYGGLALIMLLSAGLFGWWLLNRILALQPNTPPDQDRHAPPDQDPHAPADQGKQPSSDQGPPPAWTNHHFAHKALLALGLGLTFLSLSVLGLGSLGLLRHTVFKILLAIMAIPQLICLVRVLAKNRWHFPMPTNHQFLPKTGAFLHFWLGFLLIPVAMLALFANLLPSGILWGHDGRGFDVLEYHLQLPREYCRTGAIQRFDHNAFSNLPANAEMLYLLSLSITRNKIDGMYLAQMVNYLLALLFAAGIYFLFRDRGRLPAALAAGLVAGPQLFFVATNAYVECYLLLMFLLALAAALALSGLLGSSPIKSPRVAAILAGIFTGAACGAKTTALVFVLPIVLLFLLGHAGKNRLRLALLCLLATVATFSPWLIKNIINCGNPVFPLAARQLGQSDWTDDQVERWQRATRPSPQDAPWPARLRKLGRELVSPMHYGGLCLPVLLLLILTFTLGRSQRPPGLILPILALIWQIAAWISLTHVQPRFLLPMLVPGAWLVIQSAAVFCRTRRPVLRAVFVAMATLVIVAHTYLAAHAFERSTSLAEDQHGFFPLAGRTEIVASAYPFGIYDHLADPDASVLLVGESRPFYVSCPHIYQTVFDRCRIGELLEEKSPDELLAHLWECGITYIYVNWREIERLRRSYGFAESVNRANFGRLVAAGLVLVSQTDGGPDGLPCELYRVPSP